MMHHVVPSPVRSIVTVVDLFIAFTVFENVMARSRTRPSGRQIIPVNHRDYRVLFPSITSPLWVEFATQLKKRVGAAAPGDRNDIKVVEAMLNEFINADHPSLAWTAPSINFQSICWVDQETGRFFPKSDYMVQGRGKIKTIEVRTLFPSLLGKMHTVAEEVNGFLEYIIP